MAHEVRALADIPDDLVQFPGPTGQLTTVCIFSSRESDGICWPPQTMHTRITQAKSMMQIHSGILFSCKEK